VRDFVAAKVAARPGVTDVIMNCAAVNSIDVSALAMLEDLIDSLSRGGVTVHLAEVKGTVMDRLATSQLLARFDGRIYPSMAAGILTLTSPPI
jgi:SulP family sulfate permease